MGTKLHIPDSDPNSLGSDMGIQDNEIHPEPSSQLSVSRALTDI